MIGERREASNEASPPKIASSSSRSRRAARPTAFSHLTLMAETVILTPILLIKFIKRLQALV
jgi:hypothetical protein